MKFEELIKKLNPLGKRSFNKVTTSDTDPMELDEAFSLNSSIRLKLIDSSDSEEEDPHYLNKTPTTSEFVMPHSELDRKVYNSTTKEIPEHILSVERPSTSSIRSMLGFGGRNPPDDDLNLAGRDHHHHSGHPGQEQHPETQLIDHMPSPFSRPARRFNFGGIRFCLIVAMIIFVLTIILTVAVVYILDSVKIDPTTDTGRNTTTHGDNSNPFNHNKLYQETLPLLDVNDIDNQERDASINHINDSALMKMLHEETTENPVVKLSHLPLPKINITSKIIRESYQDAFNITMNEKANVKNSKLIQHALVMELAYSKIVQRLNLTIEQAEEGEVLLINATLPADLCPDVVSIIKPSCNQTELYRSLDGICNNFRQPKWGSVSQPYRRLLFPKYDDGISSPRGKGSKNSLPNKIVYLPSPRLVSHVVHTDEYRADKESSMMVPFWANFIGHDIIYTAKSSQETTNGCCKKDSMRNSSDPCFPIVVPANDPFYGDKINVTCLEFERADPHGSCQFGPRDQSNKATAFIDASQIYGVTPEKSASLRTKDQKKLGQLDIDGLGGVNLLPSMNGTVQCLSKSQGIHATEGQICFRGGDDRVNDLISVTAIQTIWVRHHNHVAETLSGFNKNWDDEKVFQETRRIIIAQIQHITYNEFLPTLLSTELLQSGGLVLFSKYSNSTSYYRDFDVNLNPTISNEFTIAFQFYVSMMQGLMKKLSPHRNNVAFQQIHKMVLNPSILKEDAGELDRLLLGASTHPALKVDAFIAGQITNHMYQRPNNSYGTDLAALIIQEGRDQGIPPYLEVAKKCGLLINVQKFADLGEIWSRDSLHAVKSVYESVQDVDMFTGLLAEQPENGSRVGPTIACIIADQFGRLRKGDMFWYEGDISVHHFTPEQLSAIRNTKLAKVICENSDKIHHLQGNIMLLPNENANPVVHCAQLSRMKLYAWKENHGQDNAHDTQNSPTDEELDGLWESSEEHHEQNDYR